MVMARIASIGTETKDLEWLNGEEPHDRIKTEAGYLVFSIYIVVLPIRVVLISKGLPSNSSQCETIATSTP